MVLQGFANTVVLIYIGAVTEGEIFLKGKMFSYLSSAGKIKLELYIWVVEVGSELPQAHILVATFLTQSCDIKYTFNIKSKAKV